MCTEKRCGACAKYICWGYRCGAGVAVDPVRVDG